jgi:hypothetical protein
MFWTKSSLEEYGGKSQASWAGIFRFTSLVLDEVYEQGIFDQPIWYRPDQSERQALLMS